MSLSVDFPVISADSHITEHPDTYSAHIDSAYRDRAPKMIDGGERGDLFVIDGMDRPIAIGQLYNIDLTRLEVAA